MEKVRIGIIGLHNHYHAYPMADYLKKGIPNAILIAVADERKKYAEEFGKAYSIDSYCDYRKLLDRRDIDAVIITSYTSAHVEHVVAAVEAGKYILLDKPIATNLSDADRMIEAARKAKVSFMMAYLLRFIPALQKSKEIIEQGVIGKPVSAFYSIRCPLKYIKGMPDVSEPGWYIDPEKSGGGGFIDHGVHFTDCLRWFFKSEVQTVFGKIANLTYTDIPVEDYGIAVFTFKSGAIATVESTWHAADWYAPLSSPDRCTITGTKGEIELHYQKSPQMEISSDKEPYRGRIYYDFAEEERYEICYRKIVEHFAECILENKEPSVTGEDGRKALEIILAAYKASKEGKEICLPLKGE